MSVTPADLVLGSKRAADKLNDPSIDDDTWLSWVDSGIRALSRKLVLAFPDTWVIPYDFTATSTGLAPLPSDFQVIRGLDLNPTLTTRREVRRYNFSNRDAGARGLVDSRCARVRYRIVGRNVSLEPREYAAGNYRLHYVARPPTLTADLTVRLATAVQLDPAPWVRDNPNELEADDVGALSVDGVLAVLGDLILVQDQVNGLHDGIYAVTRTGSPFVIAQLTRVTAYAEGTTIAAGFAVRASEGAVNGGAVFVNSADAVVFSAALNFVADNRALDPRMEPYREWIETYAAIKGATAKEDSNIGDLNTQLAVLTKDIEEMAASTDEAEADCVSDVEDGGW